MHRFARLIAAAIVLVLAGLPVTRVVCVGECTTSHGTTTTAAKQSDTTEHCHQGQPSSTSTLQSVTPDACDTLGVRDAAMRERAAPLVQAGTVVVYLHARATDLPHTSLLIAHRSRGKISGVSPGVLVPLRL
jgi:hypothetical protein